MKLLGVSGEDCGSAGRLLLLPSKRWWSSHPVRVVILPNVASRIDVIAATDALNYCEALADSRCLVWHRRELWSHKVLTISSVTVIWSVLLFLRLMRRCVSPRGSECRIPMMLVDLLDSRQTTAMRSTRSWHPEVQWLGFAAPALVMSPKGTVTCRTNSDLIHYHNVQQMPVRAGWALLQALRRIPALTRLII